jgi:hypothetical protein
MQNASAPQCRATHPGIRGVIEIAAFEKDVDRDERGEAVKLSAYCF